MAITERELRAHFGNRDLTLYQRYLLERRMHMRRMHERLMDEIQAGRSDGAYAVAVALAHITPKETK